MIVANWNYCSRLMVIDRHASIAAVAQLHKISANYSRLVRSRNQTLAGHRGFRAVPINDVQNSNAKTYPKFQPVARTWAKELSRLGSIQSFASFSPYSPSFRISDEVLHSIESKLPVIALETAIVSHGMPYPDNIETAFKVEEIIRHQGAVPATVGVIKGQLVVGLTNEEVEWLGKPSDEHSPETFVKISRRDIPFVLSQRLSGGTTISGTIVAAAKAKIPIFVTGGLGGVHRGAEHTFDISADLTELGRNPITVISSGVKSILDIGKTLEYLETEGVCVCVFRSNSSNRKFPSFFTAESQHLAPYQLKDEFQAAKLIHSISQFGLTSGALIAVPIPKDGQAHGEAIENAIQKALENADKLGIKGRDITPYVLGQVNEITGGASLSANKILIKNNAYIGAKIAVELAKLRTPNHFSYGHDQRTAKFHSLASPVDKSEYVHKDDYHNQSSAHPSTDCIEHVKKMHKFHMVRKGRPVIIGGSSLDLVFAVKESEIFSDGRTHQSDLGTVPGGVARNMAEALARLGHDPLLISAVGDDLFGHELLENFKSTQMDTTGIKILPSTPTAVYSAVLSQSGECVYGLGQMKAHDNISRQFIEKHEDDIKSASLVIIDANIPVDSLGAAMQLCTAQRIPVWFEPTELRKVKKLLLVNPSFWPCLTFISPNLNELFTLAAEAESNRHNESKMSTNPTQIHSAIRQCFNQFVGLQLILLTLGKNGFSAYFRNFEETISAPLNFNCVNFRAPIFNGPDERLASVSGAGDCLNAGFISGMLSGKDLEYCAIKAIECARKSLLSHFNVPLNL